MLTMTPRTRRLAIVTGIVAALVAITLTTVGIFNYRYRGRALPNTTVYGIDASGMKEAEVAAALDDKIQGSALTVSIANTVEPVAYRELGVELPTPEVAAAVTAHPGWFSSVASWWKSREVDPQLRVNRDKLSNFVNQRVSDDLKSGRPAAVVYNAEDGTVTVEPSIPGRIPDVSTFAAKIQEAIVSAPTAEVELTFNDQPPAYDTAAAQQVADSVKARLGTDIAVTFDDKDYRPSEEQLRSFIAVTAADDGAQNMSVVPDAVKAWVDEVVDDVSIAVRNGINRVYEDGEIAQQLRAARDGREVTNADDLVEGVTASVQEGKPFAAEVKTREVKAKTENRVVSRNAGAIAYAAEADEKWIDVNLSNHTTTAYVGDTIVRGPVAMVNGAPDTPTVRGNFKVWAKVRSQTMRGPGYVTPGVPWILYFHGDYALHGAYWRSSFGHAGPSGSHGCINLPVGTARWFYEWASVGTPVIVHD